MIDDAGDIVTNYHVIEGANRSKGVSVQFEDNVTRTAAVVAQAPNNDLALLKVKWPGPQVRPLELGDSTTVRVGDPTLAIGNPFGLDRTLTSGIVSALQRQIQAPSGFSIDNVIQTDAADQPRQLRRTAARRGGARDRHQLPDRDRRRLRTGQRRNRIRDPGQHRQAVPA